MWIKNHFVVWGFNMTMLRRKNVIWCVKTLNAATHLIQFSHSLCLKYLYNWTHGGVVATEWSGTKTSPLLSCSVAAAVSPRSSTPSSSSGFASTSSSLPRSPRPRRRPVPLQGVQRPGATARSPGPAGGRASGTPAQTSGLQRNTITSQTKWQMMKKLQLRKNLVSFWPGSSK